jgi:hypothetical protein
MNDIQIEIQGKDSVEATEALLSNPEMSGNWQPVAGTYKEATIVTIATIVAIVGSTLAAAEQIRKWYEIYRGQPAQGQQSDKKIEKALIVGRNGQRLLLENATIDEIRQILES